MVHGASWEPQGSTGYHWKTTGLELKAENISITTSLLALPGASWDEKVAEKDIYSGMGCGEETCAEESIES